MTPAEKYESDRFLDDVMTIIRRTNESHRERSLEIGRLLRDD
jgi:hypothetical protein